MNAWQGLLRKEFRQSRIWLFAGLMLLIPGSMVSYYNSGLSFNFNMVGFGIFLIGSHFAYMGLYMFSSLNKEADKLHLWLHNPQPAKNLLLAKLLSALFSMLISLTVVSLFTLTIAKITILNPPIAWSNIWQFVTFILLNIVAASIYISMWVILAWTVYKVLKNMIGNWAWLGGIGVFIIPSPLLEKFSQTSVYKFLTGWGPIELSFLQPFEKLSSEIANISTSGSLITVGYYVFHLVIIILLFLLSSWLLDNKVEV